MSAEKSDTFQGKTVLISGGTSGIGLACAKKFLLDGANVVLLARNRERGQQASEELTNFGSTNKVLFIAGDVSKQADCAAAVAKTVAMFGSLDCVVNSAGIYVEGAIEAMTSDILQQVMSTNVNGTFYMCQAATPELKKSQGNIVNIASDAGVHGNYYCSVYCASKGAVVMLTKALALELAAFGVRVNAVAPGDIMTPLTEAQLVNSSDKAAALREMAAVYPLGRIGTAEEVASAVLLLASPAASFTTGAIWSVDGGLTA